MSGVTLSNLVEAALTGRTYNHQRLGNEAKRYSRKITNRFCADFPEDRHEEVFTQAFVELWSHGAEALTDTTGQALFRRGVFAAIRVVRSDYAEPGRRTRRPPKKAPPAAARVAAEDVGRIADAETVERCTVGEGEQARVEFDLLESPIATAAISLTEDRLDLDRALGGAPPEVAAALRLICVRGETLSFAADEVGVNRFALTRRMDAFCPLWRLAA
jgi:DNA-directed RNA polymerase specialized sigma24 family protein